MSLSSEIPMTPRLTNRITSLYVLFFWSRALNWNRSSGDWVKPLISFWHTCNYSFFSANIAISKNLKCRKEAWPRIIFCSSHLICSLALRRQRLYYFFYKLSLSKRLHTKKQVPLQSDPALVRVPNVTPPCTAQICKMSYSSALTDEPIRFTISVL